MNARVAIVVTDRLPAKALDGAASDESPRHWIAALADELNAQVFAPTKRRTGHMTLRGIKAAWSAFRRRGEYDVVITDAEAAGFALAVLFKLTRSKKKLVIYGEGRATHKGPDRIVRLLGVRNKVDSIICLGQVNADRYVEILNYPREKIHCIPRPMDHHFWRPLDLPTEDFICSAVGQEYQDYPTLVEAIRGTDAQLHVAGTVPWQLKDTPDVIPDNITFKRYNPVELREMYSKAAFVAVSLRGDRGGQAGSRVVYEAMSMGKAVIATRSRGLIGLGVMSEGETCLFVDSGDAEGWRTAIATLRNDPAKVQEMGAKARKVVENGVNLRQHVTSVAEIVRALS